MNTSELATLRTLYDASTNCFALDLHNAYRTVPQDDLRALISQGFWYRLSATQGNLTERGAEALREANMRGEHDRMAALTKFQGDKYVAGRTGPEIAKLIRADIKTAQKTGLLPADMTVSVRFSRATHSKAIDVVVKAYKGQIWSTKRARHDVFTPNAWPMPSMLCSEASTLLAVLKSIANAYNYDRSDSMTDYYNSNFYLDVEFSHELKNASQKATEATVRAAYGEAA